MERCKAPHVDVTPAFHHVSTCVHDGDLLLRAHSLPPTGRIPRLVYLQILKDQWALPQSTMVTAIITPVLTHPRGGNLSLVKITADAQMPGL